MADLSLFLAEAGHAVTAAAEHAEPSFIFGPGGWVAMAMALLIAVMVWKKVPAMVGAMLDGRIAEIRKNLDEAALLRAEAEAMRNDYGAKLAALDSDAAAMRARAEAEAETLVAKARDDAKALITRRQKMAEDRIAAAERAAVADVRDAATRAAVDASRTLIAGNHKAADDKPLIERAIADIAQL